jgi:hypothetical protein
LIFFLSFFSKVSPFHEKDDFEIRKKLLIESLLGFSLEDGNSFVEEGNRKSE